MMLPTHALAGMSLAIPVGLLAPEFTSIAIIAGLIGGIVPDLDMYAGHRKTLHFPVYYSILAVLATVLAMWYPATFTIVIALVLGGAALHCLADIFGNGLELRPWEARSQRAVYSHYHGTWIPPKRLVQYDGSPRDLLLTVSLAIPLLIVLDGALLWLVVSALSIACAYTALRRSLPRWASLIVGLVPTWTMPYVPERYIEPIDPDVAE